MRSIVTNVTYDSVEGGTPFISGPVIFTASPGVNKNVCL